MSIDDRLLSSGTSLDYSIKSNVNHLLCPVIGRLQLATMGCPLKDTSIVYILERVQLTLDLINKSEGY